MTTKSNALNTGAIIAALVLQTDRKIAKNLIEFLSGELVELKEKGINISGVSIKNVPDGYYSEDIEHFIGNLLMVEYAKQGNFFNINEEGKDICKKLINEELENDAKRESMQKLLSILNIPTIPVVK